MAPAWHKHDWPLKNRVQHVWFTFYGTYLSAYRQSAVSVQLQLHVGPSFRSLQIVELLKCMAFWFHIYLTALYFSWEQPCIFLHFSFHQGWIRLQCHLLKQAGAVLLSQNLPIHPDLNKKNDILRTFLVEALLSNVVLKNENICIYM